MSCPVAVSQMRVSKMPRALVIEASCAKALLVFAFFQNKGVVIVLRGGVAVHAIAESVSP